VVGARNKQTRAETKHKRLGIRNNAASHMHNSEVGGWGVSRAGCACSARNTGLLAGGMVGAT
jgi:hypothetical protein